LSIGKTRNVKKIQGKANNRTARGESSDAQLQSQDSCHDNQHCGSGGKRWRFHILFLGNDGRHEIMQWHITP